MTTLYNYIYNINGLIMGAVAIDSNGNVGTYVRPLRLGKKSVKKNIVRQALNNRLSFGKTNIPNDAMDVFFTPALFKDTCLESYQVKLSTMLENQINRSKNRAKKYFKNVS